MAAIVEDGKLRLTGYVGDYYFEEGFTSSDVVLALSQIEDAAELDVFLNSAGGVASEGAAIHALLSSRSGVTNVIIEGIAASAASLIAMAGATVTMSSGAVMMIHDPRNATFGDSAAHAKTIEELEAFATAYARVYAAKSGKSPEACREIMKAERWFNPEQAVEEGFADVTTETQAVAFAAFDYRFYDHAPKNLKSLASKKNWRLPDADNRAASASSSKPKPQKDPPMPEDNNGGAKPADLQAATAEAARNAVAAYQARRKAIMALKEAKGREALAETLIDTDLTEDVIKSVLTSAPVAAADEGDGKNGEGEWRPPQMNAHGLNREPVNGNGGKPTMRVNLVADMKRRHGVS